MKYTTLLLLAVCALCATGCRFWVVEEDGGPHHHEHHHEHHR